MKMGHKTRRSAFWEIQNGVPPVKETNGVQQELNSVFFPELLPVVFDDGGHVLDVTFTTGNTRAAQHRFTGSHTHAKTQSLTESNRDTFRLVKDVMTKLRLWTVRSASAGAA